MRIIRIHVDAPLAIDADVSLPKQAAEHVARVLRLTVDEQVTLFNGDGNDYPARLLSVGKNAVAARVLAAQSVTNESPLRLTLAQGIARGEKMDFIVQKATELGVARIVPLMTERSEVRLDEKRAEKRLQHWRAVAASACEQSGRAHLPEISPAQSLTQWLGQLGNEGGLRLALLPEADGAARSLRFGAPGGTVAVGPEGGLGERDTRLLESAGFSGLRLGPRILRTETAGLAALAALQALHGDL